MEPILTGCIEPSPAEARAVGPPPPGTPDLLEELIDFVRDVALWTETLEGGVLPPDVEDDLEQLGSRASDLTRRARRHGGCLT